MGIFVQISFPGAGYLQLVVSGLSLGNDFWPEIVLLNAPCAMNNCLRTDADKGNPTV